LGNKSFPDKKRNDGSTVGYAYGCYSENEIAECEDWTAEQIVQRSVRLLKFMEERWGISLGTDAQKVEMLGLDFVGNTGTADSSQGKLP
jgi:hypothetical protein